MQGGSQEQESSEQPANGSDGHQPQEPKNRERQQAQGHYAENGEEKGPQTTTWPPQGQQLGETRSCMQTGVELETTGSLIPRRHSSSTHESSDGKLHHERTYDDRGSGPRP